MPFKAGANHALNNLSLSLMIILNPTNVRAHLCDKLERNTPMAELAKKNDIPFDLVTRITRGWEGLCPFPFPEVPTSLKNAEPRYLVKKSELSILVSEIARIKANAYETHMLAYRWMEAHDKLRAGEPYRFPKPTDLPEALGEIDRLRSIIAKSDEALATSRNEALVRFQGEVTNEK